MLVKLHETSNYSAERQLFTLLDELYQQKSIVATDFITKLTEIMSGIRILDFIKLRIQFFYILFVLIFRSCRSKQCDLKGTTHFTSTEV